MTSRGQHDDPLAGLLARTLAGGLGNSCTECPAPEILAAFFDRSVLGEESASLELHFSTCGRCQEQLAAMTRMEAAGTPAAQPVSPRSAWVWNLRWLMPAAAAMGAVALWVVLRAPDSIGPHSGETVKMAQNHETPGSAERAKPAAPEPGKLSGSDAAQPPASVADKVDQLASQQPKEQGAADQAATGVKAPVPGVGRASNPSSSQRSFADTVAAPSLPQTATLAESQQQPKPALADQKQVPALQATEKERAEETQGANKVAGLTTLKAETAQAQQDNFRQDKDKQQTPAGGVRAAEAQSQAARDETKKKVQVEQAAQSAPAPTAPGKESRDQAGFEFRTRRMNELDSRYVTVPVAGAQVLWRAGPGGSMERSLDAGGTWLRQASGVTADLLAGSAPSANVCWVAGRGGVLLRTTDGITWTHAGSPSALDLVGIEARDANRAVVTTFEGKRYATTDGGHTWRSL